MKKRYDFTQAVENPYAKRLKRSVTIRLDQDTIAFFQSLSRECDRSYPTLISLYLRDCAKSGRRLQLKRMIGSKRGTA
ncbi:MAG: antitoxin [Planctomycetes bacterium]|nr:antitoxin [Planctomycetota bacterium]